MVATKGGSAGQDDRIEQALGEYRHKIEALTEQPITGVYMAGTVSLRTSTASLQTYSAIIRKRWRESGVRWTWRDRKTGRSSKGA